MKAPAPSRCRWTGSTAYSLALLSTGLLVSNAPAAVAESSQPWLTFDLPPTAPGSTPLSLALAAAAPADSTPETTISPLKIPDQAIAPPLGKTAARQPLPPPPQTSLTATLPLEVQAMFAGDANSWVAIAIGSAEGTRTPEGNKTPAYYGHVDPGNGAWNLGSFSYQHGAASPEAADQQQLERLKTQAQQLLEAAQAQGMTLSDPETLNGLDLANQSPAAAFSHGGYLDRLLEARQMGLAAEEAIAWARTRSFLDPDTRQWNAPGLGNTVERISSDQERRMRAIAQTFTQRTLTANLTANQTATNQSQASPPPQPNQTLTHPMAAQVLATPVPDMQVIDQLLSLDLPPVH